MNLLRLAILTIVRVALLAAAWFSPPWNDEQARAVVVALFAELKPVTLKNCTLRRYGGPNDGGYLMCENLVQGTQSLYSYGIDTEDNWGCELSSQLKVPVHQYDCFTE